MNKMKKWFGQLWLKQKNNKSHCNPVTTIPRTQHTISRSEISGHALQVMRQLHHAGFDAYLVGGCVRDLLLGKHPKDFDVVTNAKPRDIKRLFRNSYLVGKRFRLAHVRFGHEIIEVATFRATLSESEKGTDAKGGMIANNNVFGTIEEDVFRRDFTINALYYKFADRSIVDYVGGMADIQAKIIRLIGDPLVRFQEDPLRMIRALRFQAKLDCILEETAVAAIHQLKELIMEVSSARLFDELMKIYRSGYSQQTFELFYQYNFIEKLFPPLKTVLHGNEKDQALQLMRHALANTDLRSGEGKTLNPAFLFAAVLWQPLQKLLVSKIEAGEKLFPALLETMDDILQQQSRHIAIPRRFSGMMREIWLLQYQLPHRRGKRAFRCYYHPRFRAAYDFLLLRAKFNEDVKELAEWWTEFQHVDDQGREQMLKQYNKKKK